jgi:uncharacterized protein (TIGR00269 family)
MNKPAQRKLSPSDKDFIEKFENRVKNTIKEYKLIDKKDKVVVACSGGKDSTVVLYLLNKFGYAVEGLIIDLLMGEWSRENLGNLNNFCDEHNIKLNIVSMRKEFGFNICYIRSIIKKKHGIRSCSICGVTKRWLLNKKAREMGATKLVTGHNLDDEAQTVVMNLAGGNLSSFVRGPKVDSSRNKKFVTRIKPLYFSFEKDIKKYTQLMGFKLLYDRCPCAKGGLRFTIRDMLDDLESENTGIKENIVRNHFTYIPHLENRINSQGAVDCEECGEPCRNGVCQFCRFMKLCSV